MRATRISRHMVLGAALFLLAPTAGGAQPGRGASAPVLLQISSVAPEKNQRLAALVSDIRSQADAFVFLSGGASRMQELHQRQLVAMFQGLRLLVNGGQRIAVGDGGTQAGIMEAAGQARRDSGYAFPLIGVAPANEIPPIGKTPDRSEPLPYRGRRQPVGARPGLVGVRNRHDVLAVCHARRRASFRHHRRQRRRHYAGGSGGECARRPSDDPDQRQRASRRCARVTPGRDEAIRARGSEPPRESREGGPDTQARVVCDGRAAGGGRGPPRRHDLGAFTREVRPLTRTRPHKVLNHQTVAKALT